MNPLKGKESALTLLRLRPQGTVYAIVDDAYYDFDRSGDKRYLYEEHTCPTNVLSNIKYLIDGDNNDPHGIWEYIATVKHEPLDSNMTTEQLATIFQFPFSKPKILS